MDTNNVSPDGGTVKSASRGAFKPARPFSRSGANIQVKVEATDNKVVDLEAARRAKSDEEQKAWLEEGNTDQRTHKPKRPSLEFIYGLQMLEGKLGQWACQASESAGSVVHRWNGVCWDAICDEDGSAHASRWLRANAKYAVNPKRADSCWRQAVKDLRGERRLPEADRKRAIVPCSDYYIEVLPMGFQLLTPDPALGMTHAIKLKTGAQCVRPYTPQPLPETSMFSRFLAQALPDPEVRELVQEQCGMTLLPGNYAQAAWWYGKAGSGKSTLAELVEAMHRHSVRLGLENLGDRFALETLIGKSLVLVDEVECERWAEGRFKTLVSGNGIGIDRKNEKALASYHSRAKWLITSNSPPFVRDKSDGVWRRLVPIQWTVVIPEAERKADFHKILLEQEGNLILDWMLEGARRIVERGRARADHELPAAARMAKQRARNNSDSVRAWADEMRVAPCKGQLMPMEDVYASYHDWCARQGFTEDEILTSRQFWRGMTEAGLVQPGKKFNRRFAGPDGKKRQQDCYEIEILGPAIDSVCNWAAKDEVNTDTNELMLFPKIYERYALWTGVYIEKGTLSPRELLSPDNFRTAMVQCGLIDIDFPDGLEKGFPIVIKGMEKLEILPNAKWPGTAPQYELPAY